MKPKYSRFASHSNFLSIASPRIVVACLAASAVHFTSSAHAADGTWTGGPGATWDTSATNWSGVAGTPWDSTNGATNRAVFATADATPVISGTVDSNGLSITDTVTISGGSTLNLAGITPTIDASADASISTIVSGTAGLAKTGAGTLTLPSANTYTGVTTIIGGVLSTGLLANGGVASGIGAAASSAANLVINGGTLKYTGAAASPTRGYTVGVNGASFDTSTSTGILWMNSNAAFTGSGARTITSTTGTGTLRLGAIGTGTGGAVTIVKQGAGTLILGGTNTYTGQLQILGGIVQYGNANLGGESSGVGHSVDISSGASLRFRHGGANLVTYNAPISGAGSVHFIYNNTGVGGGSLTLGGDNSFTGGLTLNPFSGSNVLTLVAGSTTALGSGNVTITEFGKLDLNGYSNTTGLLVSAGTFGIVTNGGAPPATLTLSSNDPSPRTFGGIIQDGEEGGGAVSIVKSGTGSQTFTGLNTYTGSTTVEAGALSITNLDTLSDTAAVNLTTGATLDLNFTGTDKVGALSIDGVFLSSGVYGAVDSGAANETSLITGTGLLNNLNANEALPHYWDATGTSWSAAASWTIDPANPATNPPGAPATTSVPIFGAAGVSDDTVELGGNQTALGLSFISPAIFTLTGGGISSDLSLGSSGIVVGAAANGVVIGSLVTNQDVDVILTASQIWTNANAAANLSTLNALNAGDNSLTLAGAGTFTLGGQVTGLNMLTLAGAGSSTFGSSVTGTGVLTLAGAGSSTFAGSVNDFTSIEVTGSGNSTFSGPVTGATSINKKGTGDLELAGTNTFFGDIILDNGSLTVSGNSSAAAVGVLVRGYGDNGTTYNTVATTATFTGSSTVAIASDKTVQLGNTSASGGFQLQTLNANGTVTHDGALIAGRAGRLNVGGTWTQNGTATIATQGGGLAALTVTSGGQFTYTSATNFLLSSSGSLNTLTKLTVDGGVMTTGVNFHNGNAAVFSGTSADIILTNGGTLKLSADIGDLFTTAGATRRVQLDIGGGTLNTNGFSTTLNVPVFGVGGITKDGAGTLTLAETNTYSGNTTVSSGTLSLSQDNTSNDASTVSIASGAFLSIGTGVIETVSKLFINGVQQDPGDYTSANSGGRITGDGTLRVTPVASGFASWIDGFGLALADQDPNDDPDNDGMDNLLEFALNGNPSLADNSILPQLVVTPTAFEFTYQRRIDSISPETTQIFQWGSTLATWPGSAVIPAASGSVPPASVTVSAGAPSDTVTDTIRISIPKTEADGSGKLFGRLQVVKP
jgi:fibronectin-binding autotransporter adhesin